MGHAQAGAGNSGGVTINTMKKKHLKAIGPIPVTVPEDAREYRTLEQDSWPFVADRNDPGMQKLAKLIGWKRLDEIEEDDRRAREEADDN